MSEPCQIRPTLTPASRNASTSRVRSRPNRTPMIGVADSISTCEKLLRSSRLCLRDHVGECLVALSDVVISAGNERALKSLVAQRLTASSPGIRDAESAHRLAWPAVLSGPTSRDFPPRLPRATELSSRRVHAFSSGTITRRTCGGRHGAIESTADFMTDLESVSLSMGSGYLSSQMGTPAEPLRLGILGIRNRLVDHGDALTDPGTSA